MTRTRAERLLGRQDGMRRARAITWWTAAGGVALTAVLAAVLGRASAAPARDGNSAGAGSTGVTSDDSGADRYGQQSGPQVQPPQQAPGWWQGGGQHASSGGS
jgi:hypothetical protein